MDNTLNMNIEQALKDRDLQLVMHKASSKFTRQLDSDSIQSCQMVAMWKAMENFDPNRGIKFITYLYKCVFVECLKEVKFVNKSKRSNGKLHDNVEAKNSSEITIMELLDEAQNDEERSMLKDRLANKTIAEMAETRSVSREIVRRRLKRLTTKIGKRHR